MKNHTVHDFVVLLSVLIVITANDINCFQPAFHTHTMSSSSKRQSAYDTQLIHFKNNPFHSTTNTALHLFGRKNSDNDNNQANEKKANDNEKDTTTPSFFDRFTKNFGGTKDDTNTIETSSTSTTTTQATLAVQEKESTTTTTSVESSTNNGVDEKITATVVVDVPVPVIVPEKDISVMTPFELATKLRADAMKARLEAERMDAELTLRKISRLERELENAKEHPERTNVDVTEQLQREMDALQAKVRGEIVPPTIVPKTSSTKQSTASSISNQGSGGGFTSPTNMTSVISIPRPTTNGAKYDSRDGPFFEGKLSTIITPFDPLDFETKLDSMKNAPNFLKKSMALLVEMEYDSLDDINVTELALRLDMAGRLDFSFSKRPKPFFTMKDIQRCKTEMLSSGEYNETNWLNAISSNPLLDAVKAAGMPLDNSTDLALMVLEYEYYLNNDDTNIFSMQQFEKIAEGEEWMKPILQQLNASAVDNAVDTLYPKCTRKDGQEPSLVQVQQFVSDILPKASFAATSKPEPVLGGYILRGQTKLNGDEFIMKLDSLMEKSSLQSKMTVLYTNDFTILAENPDELDVSSLQPILYITGPDIVRESKPIQLSIVTAIGIATSWYLSLYPFLLNPSIATRVDEQVALADAGMTPDLGWLTDLSIPLFATFLGIQFFHELGHTIAAGANNIKNGPPTFVPSIITGITSSVTTFRSPPKNNAAMFDFAIAGPLFGMVASIAAITLGSQLTILSDTAMFPALPLEILRQSTLGGGIINGILGNGVLSVPEGARGTLAVAGMTVPLHPIAIAGYISLIINALSLLPIGTTDGGRIALSLFGRAGKLLIGNIFLFITLVLGLIGSDLFLFYFAFIIAFQTGNEVPSRNEVDKIDFPRAGVAAAAYVVAILALVPFQ